MRIRVNSDVYLEWMSRVAYAQVEVSQMNESFLTYEFERHVNEVWTILKFGYVYLKWMDVYLKWMSRVAHAQISVSHVASAQICKLGCVSHMNGINSDVRLVCLQFGCMSHVN